jgi:hypothetical protein
MIKICKKCKKEYQTNNKHSTRCHVCQNKKERICKPEDTQKQFFKAIKKLK